MGKKLYVGNLGYGVVEADLETLFSVHGPVRSVQVIQDRETGRSKGFGFVEMENDADATAAISSLNGKDMSGRSLTVNEARPRAEGGSRGSFGGSSGGGRSGGYGGGGGRDRR